MTVYQNFPWHRIAVLFPRDWANYQLALTAIGNNVYYGFRRDLGPAKSTGFRNLTYVATQLLIKCGGETNLRSHGGLPTTCSNKPQTSAILEAYLERMRDQAEANADEILNPAPDGFHLFPAGFEGAGMFV
uniref:Uncharacterized protein n=1 Tax=Cacopsylla melanoneura TaxID=428564 RepID=A0A8D8W6Q7_9HEMI